MNYIAKSFMLAILFVICIVFVPDTALAATSTFHAKNDPWPNKTIPDNGGYYNRVNLQINVSGVPSDARIKSVKYTCWVDHTYRGDLSVDLTAYINNRWVSHRISDRQGGSADNIDQTETFTTFNGGCVSPDNPNPGTNSVSNFNPNGQWYLVAWDNATGDEGALDGIEIWIEWETQEATIIDAWIKSGSWVDNDGDDYASALSLEWDAKVNYSTMSVYANLRADDWLSGERNLGNTSNYTLGTSATRKSFVVPVNAQNLKHKTWDFQIDLYKAGTSTRVARLSMGADQQLNDVKVELPSEDTPPPPPSLSRSPSSLSRMITQGENATSQSFEVWNSGGGTLSYSISDNASWLSVNPTAGTSTGEHDTITVNYSTSGLTAGSYPATITITASGAGGSPQTIGVSLNVNPPLFVPYFQDARITSRTDTDGDGYASQFTIEFNVNSNVYGNCYVKIYEYDGSSILDDYMTTSSTFSVSGTTVDYRGVAISCDSYPGSDKFSHGTAEIKLELYNATNNQLIKTWTPSNDSDLGNVKVELSSEERGNPGPGPERGNTTAQEYGDALYDKFDLFNLGYNYNHAGLLAGIDGNGTIRTFESSNSDFPEDPNNDPRTGPQEGNFQHRFKDGGADYYGAFIPSKYTSTMPFKDRKSVVSKGRDVVDADISYPSLTNLNALNYKSGSFAPLDPVDISSIRCDGLVEYSYERVGIRVWANCTEPDGEWSIAYYPDNHNNNPGTTVDPQFELSPWAQRGGTTSSTTGPSYSGPPWPDTKMTKPSVVNVPTIQFTQLALTSTYADIEIRATDESGVFKILGEAYRNGAWTSIVSQQNTLRHPTSDSYTVQVRVTGQPGTSLNLHAKAQDHGGNWSGWYNTTITFPNVYYNLTTSVQGHGSISPYPGGSYISGTTVPVSATETVSGWHFARWGGNLSGSSNPTTIVMNNNKSVTAIFEQDMVYSLNVNIQGQGTVSLNPSGGIYNSGTVVQVTAIESFFDWLFVRWEGDLSGSSNPTTIVMNNNKNIDAIFELVPPPSITKWEIAVIHGTTEISTQIQDGYTEPRINGVTKLRIYFDQAMDTSVTDPVVISVDDVAYSYGTLHPSAITWQGNNCLVATFTSPLPDQKTCIITASTNIKSASQAALGGDRDIYATCLKGDANGSLAVNAQDMLAIRAHVGESVSSGNAKYDINCNGTINAQDMLAVKANVGHSASQHQ